MRRRGLRALLVLLALVGAGCTAEKPVAFQPGSSDRMVTGTLGHKFDGRPADGGVWLTLAVGPGREERVYVPSMFNGQPPSTETLALQQKVDEIEVGDRLSAVGERDATGTLIVRRIVILEP